MISCQRGFVNVKCLGGRKFHRSVKNRRISGGLLGENVKKAGRVSARPAFRPRLVSGCAAKSLGAAAGCAVVAQLEGRALGLLAVAHAVLTAAHLDLVQGAALILMMGAAVHGAFDAGVRLLKHS